MEENKIEFIRVTCNNGNPLMLRVNNIVSVKKYGAHSEVCCINGEKHYLEESFEDMTNIIPWNYSLKEIESL